MPVLIPYSPCTLPYPLFPLHCYHIPPLPLSNGSCVFTRPRHLHMHALFRAATACGRRPAGPAARTEHSAARRAQYPLPRTRAATHCASCVSPRRVVVSLCCRCVVLCGAVVSRSCSAFTPTPGCTYTGWRLSLICVFVVVCICICLLRLVHLHIPTRVHRSSPSQCPT